MNILLVTAMFPPIKTGTSFYSRNLADALYSRGHRITVVTLQNEEDDSEHHEYVVHRLPAIHIPFLSFFKHFRISSFYPGNYAILRRVARECGAEVIILVNHYLDIAFPAIFASRSNRIPLICSVGTQLQSSSPWNDRLLNFFDRQICGRLIFPFCERIVAWDKQILKYLADVHGHNVIAKSVIVNFGVNGDPRTFLSHVHDYRLHNQILGIGSVLKQRSFVPLVRAFRELTEEFLDLRLKIIGHVYHDAALQAATQLGIEARVDFTGELPHEQVLEELKRSDIYYVSLTAKYLGLGTATTESMLMGVPVVANIPPDLLGTAVFKNMEDIVIAQDENTSNLASQIRALLKNGELRRRIGQNGRNFVLENMTWEKVVTDFEAVLQSVANPNEPLIETDL